MDKPLIRIMALHALAYCERLFIWKKWRKSGLWTPSGRTLHEAAVVHDTGVH